MKHSKFNILAAMASLLGINIDWFGKAATRSPKGPPSNGVRSDGDRVAINSMHCPCCSAIVHREWRHDSQSGALKRKYINTHGMLHSCRRGEQ